MKEFLCGLRGTLTWLLAALMFMPIASQAVDQTFDLIQTKTAVYSNVTVTTKSAGFIVVQHARGLTSLKVTELSPEVQQVLGYGPVKTDNKNSSTVTAKAKALVSAISPKQIEEAWSNHAPAGTPSLKLNSTILLIILGVFAFIYLFFCYCGSLICQKTGKPGGLLIWLPALQFIPLYRAANMSPLWMLAMFVPLLNIVGHFHWSFRIANARGQGFWTALFLFLPTYPLAFIYLAFAGGTSSAGENSRPEKIRTTSLALEQA